MKRTLIVFLSIGLFFAACSDADDPLTGINVQIQNSTTLVFDNVEFGTNEIFFEEIAPDSLSGFLTFETLLSSEGLQVETPTGVLEIDSLNFNGSETLGRGTYTFDLSLSDDEELLLEIAQEVTSVFN